MINPPMELVEKVKFADKAPYPRKVAKKACIKEGLAFEAQAQIQLEKLGFFGKAYHSKWIEFQILGETSVRYAQPDSFFVAPEVVYIFEMKLRHTPRSAAQLAKYGELLQALYPKHKIKLIEVYKYWDWIVYPAKSEKVDAQGVLKIPFDTIGLLHIGH